MYAGFPCKVTKYCAFRRGLTRSQHFPCRSINMHLYCNNYCFLRCYMTYVFVGGRDYVGRPIISLTQPKQNGVEDLMELTDQELLDMFAYFTSVPRCSPIATPYSMHSSLTQQYT